MDDESTDTRELRIKQGNRKTEERKLESGAAVPDEEDQHRRRGDKAAYLEEKLAERERSERES